MATFRTTLESASSGPGGAQVDYLPSFAGIQDGDFVAFFVAFSDDGHGVPTSLGYFDGSFHPGSPPGWTIDFSDSVGGTLFVGGHKTAGSSEVNETFVAYIGATPGTTTGCNGTHVFSVYYGDTTIRAQNNQPDVLATSATAPSVTPLDPYSLLVTFHGFNADPSTGEYRASTPTGMTERLDSHGYSSAIDPLCIKLSEEVFTGLTPTGTKTSAPINISGTQSDGPRFGWSILFSAPPSNDNFVDAQLITGSSGTSSADITTATIEVAEPLFFDYPPLVVHHTLWWKWTAPSTGVFQFDTLASPGDPDTRLDVFAGSALGALTLLASKDDATIDITPSDFPLRSLVAFEAEVGTEYHIRVGGYRDSSIGPIVLSWLLKPAHPVPAPFIPVPSAIWAFGVSYDDVSLRWAVFELAPSDTDWRLLGYAPVGDPTVGITDNYNIPYAYGNAAHDSIQNRNVLWFHDNPSGTLRGDTALGFYETVGSHIVGDPEDGVRLDRAEIFSAPGSTYYHARFTIDGPSAGPAGLLWLNSDSVDAFHAFDALSGAPVINITPDLSALAPSAVNAGHTYWVTDDFIIFSYRTSFGNYQSIGRYDRAGGITSRFVDNLNTSFPSVWPVGATIDDIVVRNDGTVAVSGYVSGVQDGRIFAIISGDGISVVNSLGFAAGGTRKRYQVNFDVISDAWFVAYFDYPIDNAVVHSRTMWIDAATLTEHVLPIIPQTNYSTYEFDVVSFVPSAFAPCSPPANDNWANATELGSATSGSVPGTTLCATIEPDENNRGDASVWYGWIAPEYGVLTFTVTPLIGGIQAYVGTTLASTVLVEETNNPSSNQLSIFVVKDTRYWIQIDNNDTFTLSWTFEAFPIGRAPTAGWIAAGFIRNYTEGGSLAALAQQTGPNWLSTISSTDGINFTPFLQPSDSAWQSTEIIIADGSTVVIGGWIFPAENEAMVTEGLVYTTDAGVTWQFPTSIMSHDHDLHLNPATPDNHNYNVPYDTWAEFGAVGNGRMVVACFIIHPDATLDEYGGPAFNFGDQTPRIITCPSNDPSVWTTSSIPYLSTQPLTHNPGPYPSGDQFPFGLQPQFDFLAFAGGFFFVGAEPDFVGGNNPGGGIDYTLPDESTHMWRSVNGIIWTEIGHLPETFSALRCLASDGVKWIGGGFWFDNAPYGSSYAGDRGGQSHGHPGGGTSHNALWRSNNAGTSWTLVSSDVLTHLFIVMVHDNGIWLASDRFSILNSSDGETWVVSSSITNVFDIYWDGSLWWASTFGVTGPTIYNSSDGITWTPIPNSFDDIGGSFRGYSAGVRRVELPPLPDPVDEPGWTLNTIHDYDGETPGGLVNPNLACNQVAVSPDERYLYLSNPSYFNTRIDMTDWSVSNVNGGGGNSIAIDDFGNIYIFTYPNSLVKFAEDGTTVIWTVSIPSTYYITYGRDGFLYSVGFLAGYHIQKIDTSDGSHVEVFPLAINIAGVGYDSLAVTSDGTIWITMDGPLGADLNVNNVVRRYKQSDSSIVDFPIQALVSSVNDGFSEMYGGIFIDFADHVIIPMVTYQGTYSPPLSPITPSLSWFLRISPAGKSTRIAGNWHYPQTASNIADGPLGVSLACEADNGAGISHDGRTLYFFDSKDETGSIHSTLVRTLSIPPPFEYSSDIQTIGTLGCSQHVAYIQDKCGGPRLCELSDISSLQYDRRLDDISQAFVEIPISGDADIACCTCLGQVEPWCHVLTIVREGDGVVWTGPVQKVTYSRDKVRIDASDKLAWLKKRVISIPFGDKGRAFDDAILNSTTTLTLATLPMPPIPPFGTVDDPSINFTSDIGKSISGIGIPAGTIITAVLSPTSIIMSQAATVTASNVVVTVLNLQVPITTRASDYARLAMSDDNDSPCFMDCVLDLGDGLLTLEEQEFSGREIYFPSFDGPTAWDKYQFFGTIGINFTVINQCLILGPPTLPAKAIGILTDEMILGDFDIIKNGEIQANQYYVDYDNDNDAILTCGPEGSLVVPCPAQVFTDDLSCYGRLMNIEPNNNYPGLATAKVVAQGALDATKITPRQIEFPSSTRLSPETPWTLGQMIPGQRIDVSITKLCIRVYQSFLLQQVQVQDGPTGEQISVTLQSISLI